MRSGTGVGSSIRGAVTNTWSVTQSYNRLLKFMRTVPAWVPVTRASCCQVSTDSLRSLFPIRLVRLRSSAGERTFKMKYASLVKIGSATVPDVVGTSPSCSLP